MKKLLVALITVLLLASCSSDNSLSKLSDGNDIIYKSDKETFTKNDLYRALKVSSSDAILNDIFKKIAIIEGVDMTEVAAQADEAVEFYQSLGYESMIISYYGSIEAYKQIFSNNIITYELAKIYVEEKLDEFVQVDNPVKLKYAKFETEEDLNQFIADLESVEFVEAATNNNAAEKVDEALTLDSDEALPLEVKEYLRNSDETNVNKTFTVLEKDSSGAEVSYYYLVNVTERDLANLKDTYIETKADEVDTDEVKSFFLGRHEIEFFDQDIYDLVTEEYEVLK